MEQEVVKPNIDYWQSHVEGLASSFYTDIFRNEPLAQSQKVLETLRANIRLCSKVEDLKVFVESNFRFYSDSAQELVKEVIDELSVSANLRNIKDGDFLIRISDIDPYKENIAVVNAGANKANRRFMIRRSDKSVYYLPADMVISADLLSKIFGLFTLKVLDECNIEQENRRVEAFPVIEYSMKKPFAKGLESVLRYAFNRMFSKFQEDVVDRLDSDKSVIYYNILRDILKLNNHLSIKLNSPEIKNSKVSIFFKQSGDIVKDIKILGKEGDYYYRDQKSGKLIVLDMRYDFVIFKQDQYNNFEKLAKDDTTEIIKSMMGILVDKLNEDRFNGVNMPDFELKTVIAISN